jgi:hypothetical protein
LKTHAISGNLLSALAELVGAITNDRKMVVKSSLVQKALRAGSSVNDSEAESSSGRTNNNNNNNEDQTSNIYKNPDIYLSVVSLIYSLNF